MPIYDWTRVEAGIYHDFHHEWISEIKRALNRGLLPPDYYAMAEQVAAGFGPDVSDVARPDHLSDAANGGGIATQTRPKTNLLRRTSRRVQTATQEPGGGSACQRGSGRRHDRDRLAGKQEQRQRFPGFRAEGLAN